MTARRAKSSRQASKSPLPDEVNVGGVGLGWAAPVVGPQAIASDTAAANINARAIPNRSIIGPNRL